MKRLTLLLTATILAAPLTAVADDAALLAKAHAIHRHVLVLDSHLDIPMDYGTGAHEAAIDGDTQVDLPKLERGGVGAAVIAVFVPQGPRTREGYAAARRDAQTKVAAIRGIAEHHPDRAELAFSPADVRRIHAAHRTAVVESFLNAYPLADDAAGVDAYYAQGVRVFGFVHAGDNAFADSSRPTGEPKVEHHGLSPLGREAVARLNRLGAVIDISQLTKEGALQTIALSAAPVVATHSGVQGVVASPRNLSDEELDALKAKGGVIQIVAFKSYLVRPGPDYPQALKEVRARFGLPEAYEQPYDGASALAETDKTAFYKAAGALIRPATVSDLVDSIDYAVKRIGVDHVGISSDFNHGGGVTGWVNEGEAENVTVELVRRGYSETDIAKLWGGNFLRVWAEAEQVAARLKKVS